MDVLTLTLNPCLDRTIWRGADGRDAEQSGGKGINAARVLSALGADCLAVAPLGGETGTRVRALAAAEGVRLVPVEIAAETRTVETIVCADDLKQEVRFGQPPAMDEAEIARRTAAETRTVETLVRADDLKQEVRFGQPPAMDEAEIARLRETVCALLPEAKILLIGGSACCPAAARLLPDLIARAKELGVRVFLDANGAALQYGAQGGPDAVKPNQAELAQLCGHAVAPGTEEEAARAALEAFGIGLAVVTLGKAGCVQVTREAALYCPAPRVETVNAVGSGDSFAAAWLYAQLRGFSDSMALAVACAAGAANARQFPAARIGKNDIEALLGYSI